LGTWRLDVFFLPDVSIIEIRSCGAASEGVLAMYAFPDADSAVLRHLQGNGRKQVSVGGKVGKSTCNSEYRLSTTKLLG